MITTHYLDIAREFYRQGNYTSAIWPAMRAIESSSITQEKVQQWLNPDTAIDHNNKGRWYLAKSECRRVTDPTFTNSLIVYLCASEIIMDCSRILGSKESGVRIGDTILSHFGNVNFEQRYTRIFTQLDFAIFNIGIAEGRQLSQQTLSDAKKSADLAVKILKYLIETIKSAKNSS